MAEGMMREELKGVLALVGRRAGFSPVREYGFWYRENFILDLVWLKPEPPFHLVAAFEVDGRDINSQNTEKALVSLGAIASPSRYLFRFTVNGNGKMKGTERPYFSDAQERFRTLGIELRMDTDLDVVGQKNLESEIKQRLGAEHLVVGPPHRSPMPSAVDEAFQRFKDLGGHAKDR